ncbi:MAG: mannonate dehydratase, partial [Gammaproteobacteria bacterium]
MHTTRRDFGKLAAAGAFAIAAGAAPKLDELPPGIKISLQIPTDPSDEDLRFALQLGVEYVSIPTGGERATLENFVRLKQKVNAAGLKVWNIGNSNVHNMPEVTLNLPGRDQKVEEYKAFLRNLAKAGIFYTTYAHMGNGIWSTQRETTRGGASARAFNLAKADKGVWAGKDFLAPLTHGRKFSKEEIWENYTYFIRQVVPVAEEL